MKWTGSKATGPILFQSGPLTTTDDNVRWGFEPVAVNTGGLHLDAGNQYVAFLSVTEYFSDSKKSAGWSAYVGEAYSGGTFVYLNNGSNSAAWTNNNWVTNYPGGDLAFTIQFNVPEPATIILLGLGGMILRKRK
jgi:hypothetical protein